VCQLCFWQRASAASQRCEVVVRHRDGRLLPLCAEHLELCRRYGYPMARLLEAPLVERALLDAYAVDVFRVV
jgi:hypothetical protein